MTKKTNLRKTEKPKLLKIKEYEFEFVFDGNKKITDDGEPVIDIDYSSLKEYEEIKLPPIKSDGRWKSRSFLDVKKINSDFQREGIPYTSQKLHTIKDWLRRRCKRPDIAETFYRDKSTNRIKTKMPYNSIFS